MAIRGILDSLSINGDEYKLVDSEIRDKINKLGFWITPQMFGAKGDGKTDDTTAFKQMIEQAKTTGQVMRIPKGRYVITSSLGEVSNCRIMGDYECVDYYNGSLIIDKRPSHSAKDETTTLLKLSGKYTIENLGFYGCDQVKNCMELAGGWDSHVDKIAIYGYQNIGMKIVGMDITINNCFIMTSGTKTFSGDLGEIHYAIEMTNKANCVHFHNLHVEHCRFMMRMRDAYTSSFTNCKFEQSTWGADINSTYPPINLYMTSNIMFTGGIMASIASGAYIANSINPVSFVYAHNSTTPRGVAVIASGTTFMAGMGSGDSSYSGIQSAKLLYNDANTEIDISGCVFRYVSEEKGIDINNAVFSGNTVEVASDNTMAKPVVAMNSVVTGNKFKKITGDSIITTGSEYTGNKEIEM